MDPDREVHPEGSSHLFFREAAKKEVPLKYGPAESMKTHTCGKRNWKR